MPSVLTGMPAWAPLVAAAIGLSGALVAVLYARHAVALACDRLERAQHFEQRLLKVLGQHPEILVPQGISGAAPEAVDGQRQEFQESLINARERLSRSTSFVPEQHDNWKPMALMLVSQGRFEEAEAICRQEVEEDPDNAQAHNTLGVVFRKTNRLEAAVASCRHATLLEPTCVSAHINLGVALRNMGRLQQAEAAYRRAIELDPSHSVAHSSLGVALNKQGRHEEAESCYLRALELDTRYTPAWLNLAIALQQRGALEEAQAAYRCALELGTAAQQMEEDSPAQAAVA